MSPHRKRVPSCRLYPLQFRKIWKKLLTLEIGQGQSARHMWRSIFGTLIAVAGIYLLIIGSTPTLTPVDPVVLLAPVAGMFFGLLFLLVIYQWLYLWTYFYDLDEHFIRIRKGVLIRREVSIPYNRIHDVYLDQDVLDRMLNLYDLYLATASPISHEETHIDGLKLRHGVILRDLLMERIRLARGQGFGPEPEVQVRRA